MKFLKDVASMQSQQCLLRLIAKHRVERLEGRCQNLRTAVSSRLTSDAGGDLSPLRGRKLCCSTLMNGPPCGSYYVLRQHGYQHFTMIFKKQHEKEKPPTNSDQLTSMIIHHICDAQHVPLCL